MEGLQPRPHVVALWVGAHEPSQLFEPVAHQHRLTQLLGHRRNALVCRTELGVISFHRHFPIGRCTTFYATIGPRLPSGSRVPSAVYLPYLPPAFSPSVLLSLSPSWLSLPPVLAVAFPFRTPSSPAAVLFRVLSSPAVCPALPSLLPAGAPRLRPPVRRPQYRRSRLKQLRTELRLSSSLSSFAM